MKVLKHIFLIVVTAIILFPIIWVVMTSLRRDEAAFSPHLFSKNLTLQHYKDLILPQDNIPYFIRELMNGIGLLPPYDGMDLRKVSRKVEKILDKFKDRMKRSEENVERSIDLFGKISNYIEDEFPSFRDSVIEKMEKFVMRIKPDGELKLEAVGKLLKDGKKDEWLKRFEIDGEKALESYQNYLGRYEDELRDIEIEISNLESNLGALKSRAQDLSLKYSEILKTISLMEREIENTVERMKSALSIHGEEEADLSKVLEKVKSVLKLLSAREELTRLYSILSEFSNTENVVRISKEANAVVKDQSKVLISLLDDLEYQLGKLSDVSMEISKLEKEMKRLEIELETLRIGREALEKKISKNLSNLKADISRAYRAYLTAYIDSKVENLLKMSSLSKRNLLKLSIIFKSMRSELRYAEGLLKADEIMELRSIVDSLSWIPDYRSLVKAMDKLKRDFQTLEGEMMELLNVVDRKWRDIFEISESGYKIYPHELDEMYELLGSMYEGRVSSALGIAMREARALSYTAPFEDIRDDFREIDALLYQVQQWWEKKPRHYFLRWVMNSVIVSGLVAIITTFVCAVAAYPFSRMRFFGRKYGIMALLLIQMFPAIMYMVALYGMLKFIGNYIPWLGLDTLGGLIFVYLGGIAFNMYLMKGYYDTIPSSLEESAMIDGATRFQTFWLIIVPLARPIIAVVIILTFIGTFNEFVLARIILQDVKNYTYALGLWSFSTGPFEMEWGLFTAAALLGMLPMVILFLSMQRFLISGLTKGSVKG